MTSVIDLTERKKAEEELRESEGRYKAVVEQAAEGIVLIDVNSKRVFRSERRLPELARLHPRSDTAADAPRSRSVLLGAFHVSGLPMRNSEAPPICGWRMN